MIKNIALTILIFLSLYPFGLIYLPPLTTRVIIGVFGFIIIFIRLISMLQTRSLLVRKNLIYIYLLLTCLSATSIVSVAINGTNQLVFLTFFQSATFSFLNAMLIYEVMKRLNRSTEFFLVKYIIFSITLQSLISLILYLRPDISALVYSYVHNSELGALVREQVAEKRISGFARSFFGAGMFSGMGLILIAYSIQHHYLRHKDIIIYTLLFLFIFIIGMMMARTTIVGAILAALLIILPKDGKLKLASSKKLKFTTLVIITPVTLLSILTFFSPNLIKNYRTLIEFGFELFINFNETGKLETSSTNTVFEMFRLPNNFTTWIIGDGLWDDPFSLGYYMNIDIGFLRLLYYFGVIGLFLYIMYHFILIKSSFNNNLTIFLIFIYFLILNIKGFSDLTPFITLFYVLNNSMYKKNHIHSFPGKSY